MIARRMDSDITELVPAQTRGLESAVEMHNRSQACVEIGAPGFDAFESARTNFNRLADVAALDPLSAAASHRGCLCGIQTAA